MSKVVSVTLFLIAVFTILLIVPSQTFALVLSGSGGSSGTNSSDTSPQSTDTTTTQGQTTQQQVASQADNEVDQQVAALTSAESAINSLNNLTASQKSDLTNQIQQDISNLNNLKTRIGSDTDSTTLQGDVQSIVDSYRIFYVFIPQIRLLAAGDTINTASANLTTLADHLQTRITANGNEGQDVTNLNLSLSDMRLKITDAQAQATTIINSVKPLTPAGFPGNVPTFKSALVDAATARADIVAAQNDAQTIINGLKTLETSSPTSTTTTPSS